jgi:hypothetical protein
MVTERRVRDRRQSNLGKWDQWYAGLEDGEPQAYGDVFSYALAADFLQDCASVEDWGCGKGWFRTLMKGGPEYTGIDGSKTPFADVVADLTEYLSNPDGILIRHVLEHNYQWQEILANAVQSARKKLCIILFTPCSAETHEIAYTEDVGVPDISFDLRDILDRMGGFEVESERIVTATQYGEETIIRGVRA